jgi:hypothetical protein
MTQLRDLDHLIDSAAHALTDADPPVDLHRHVMAQLGERRRPWTWRLIPAGAVVLALVMIAVFVGRRLPSPATSASVKTAAVVAPAPMAQPEQASSSSPDGAPGNEPVSSGSGPRGRHVPMARIADVHAEWLARALPALSPPEALTLDRIQPESLAIRPLETRPLVIAPIEADGNRFEGSGVPRFR